MSNLPYCHLAVYCVVGAKVWIPIRRVALIEETLSGICVPGTTSEARTFAGLSAMSCGNLRSTYQTQTAWNAGAHPFRRESTDRPRPFQRSKPVVTFYLLPVTSRLSRWQSRQCAAYVQPLNRMQTNYPLPPASSHRPFVFHFLQRRHG